jgi:hypothetical protein
MTLYKALLHSMEDRMKLTPEQLADIANGKTKALAIGGNRQLRDDEAKALAEQLKPYTLDLKQLNINCGLSPQAYRLLDDTLKGTKIVNPHAAPAVYLLHTRHTARREQGATPLAEIPKMLSDADRDIALSWTSKTSHRRNTGCVLL